MSAVLRCRQGRGSGGGEGFVYIASPWQCVAAMAPLESVHFSECVHVMCVHVRVIISSCLFTARELNCV